MAGVPAPAFRNADQQTVVVTDSAEILHGFLFFKIRKPVISHHHLDPGIKLIFREDNSDLTNTTDLAR